jgi:hypothetical protein
LQHTYNSLSLSLSLYRTLLSTGGSKERASRTFIGGSDDNWRRQLLHYLGGDGSRCPTLHRSWLLETPVTKKKLPSVLSFFLVAPPETNKQTNKRRV